MIEAPHSRTAEPALAGPAAPFGVGSGAGGGGVIGRLASWIDELAELPDATDSAEQIDRIAVLEQLGGAVAAAKARAMTRFAGLQLEEQAAAGVPRNQLGRGIAEQISYACRISPATASRQLSFSTALQVDLPAIFAALQHGDTNEWTARLITKETRELPHQTRRQIADELAPDLSGMSPRQAETAARRMAYEADPQAILARSRTARSDRYVSLRPAPDTMAVLSAFLPVEQGVAAYANLDRYAKAQRASGDPRSLAQVRADTLVERLTGQSTAAAVPVEINLTMTADTLVDALDPDASTSGADQTPAQLNGYGPIPADLALDLAANAYATHPALEPAPEPVPGASQPAPSAAHDAATGVGSDDPSTVWLRRIMTDPVDDSVTDVDPQRRRFDVGLARFIRYRDQTCRDRFCDAPIRHTDHVEAHRDGGPTSAANGAGLCERGNYVKEMPGWMHKVLSNSAAQPGQDTEIECDGAGLDHADSDSADSHGAAGGGHRIEIRTPTGHRYISTPPPALGPGGNYQERRRRAAAQQHLKADPEPADPEPADPEPKAQQAESPIVPQPDPAPMDTATASSRPVPVRSGPSGTADKPALNQRLSAKVRQYRRRRRRRTNRPAFPPRRN